MQAQLDIPLTLNILCSILSSFLGALKALTEFSSSLSSLTLHLIHPYINSARISLSAQCLSH